MRALLLDLGLDEKEPFALHIGRHEAYCRGVIAHELRAAEVYLYADEAGFICGDQRWVRFEKADYATELELIDDLQRELRAALAD